MGSLIRAVVQLGVRVLPPTIHPMVVHFPIALLYVTAGAEALALVTRSAERDRFWDRAAFWLLTLSGAAIVAAGAAGVISEHSVHLTHTTAGLLAAHQRDATLTGLFALLAWGFQLAARFSRTPGRNPGGTPWSVLGSGRGRVTGVVLACGIAAAVMVSITGTLGGSMVYQHCLGVPTATCQAPAHSPRAGAAG